VVDFPLVKFTLRCAAAARRSLYRAPMSRTAPLKGCGNPSKFNLEANMSVFEIISY
jgi:hypothetical protein